MPRARRDNATGSVVIYTMLAAPASYLHKNIIESARLSKTCFGTGVLLEVNLPMHTRDTARWQHDHVFAQDRVRPGEKRTLIVVAITATMMIVEIAAGLVYGSMALLADGLHMASHAAALGIAFLAYVIARRLAADQRFSFGTGKLNSLAGFASAVLLLGFALIMVTESTSRFIAPVEISYDQALVVAVLGLIVNGVSAWIFAATPHDGHDHH